MTENSTSAPSMQVRDFLAAFDLDRANIHDLEIHHENDGLIIDIELNVSEHTCPVCGTSTSKIKGYQLKKIRHSVLNPVPCTIHYRARRYVCPICGKTFYEKNPFIATGLKVSVATVYNVLLELKRPEATFKYVADKYHMSPSSVSNIFDRHVRPSRRPLPECLSFDETYAFRSDGSDYICVLLDHREKKIVDILPSRRKSCLLDYFHKIPLEERKKVKYVCFDMWQTYRMIAKLMFPNCQCIVDKFHILQELSRRVTRVRVDVMNRSKMIKDELEYRQKLLKAENRKLAPQDQEKLRQAKVNYYLLKKFNFVLFSNDPDIADPNIEKKYNHVLARYSNLNDIYHMIMDIDDGLAEAVNIRDWVHRFYRTTAHKDAKAELEDIIIACRTSKTKPIQEFSNTLTEWKQEIINSFIKIPTINRRMNNALIENRNKSIKLIKHSSNGYTNWERFRARVLYTLNDDTPIRF